MTAYVALIRAVNVTGTGKLPNADLKAMGEACGFDSARTYINSGNLLFTSDLDEKDVRERMAERIDHYFGRHVPVHVRSAAEMAQVAARNPFSDDNPSRVAAFFIDEEATQAMIDAARDVGGERLALGPRVIYVSYGQGMASTRLKLPAGRTGTARNMNTVARLAEMLKEMA